MKQRHYGTVMMEHKLSGIHSGPQALRSSRDGKHAQWTVGTVDHRHYVVVMTVHIHSETYSLYLTVMVIYTDNGNTDASNHRHDVSVTTEDTHKGI